jgi:hypothetical protein
MGTFNFQRAIYKYAILLSITYFINLAWVYYFQNYLVHILLESQNRFYNYVSLISIIIGFIFNIIFAILVFKDFRKNEIKSPLIVIITLLFGFLGIALFFIQLFYNQYVKKASTQQSV